MERKWGYLREPEDNSKYALSLPIQGIFESKYDLSAQFPACWDQGQTGTCVLHGLAAVKWSAHVREGINPFKSSILYPYYNGRQKEGTLGNDSGMYIFDSMWVSHEFGFIPDSLWPFDPSKMEVKPSVQVYDEGMKDTAHNYASVKLSDPNAIKLALSHKLPISMGLDVYRSFESIGPDGIMPMPGSFERFMGGHCTVIIGCDDSTEFYTMRNSWGSSWGKNGNYYMPYDYMHSQHCSDGWVYRL